MDESGSIRAHRDLSYLCGPRIIDWTQLYLYVFKLDTDEPLSTGWYAIEKF